MKNSLIIYAYHHNICRIRYLPGMLKATFKSNNIEPWFVKGLCIYEIKYGKILTLNFPCQKKYIA